jgi:hypothetical protein
VTPLDASLAEEHRLSGSVIEWRWIRLISPFINLYAVTFLVGGAAASALRFRKNPEFRNRYRGNILIAIGAILPGIGGAMTRAGYVEALYVTELVGLLLIFAGYRACVVPMSSDLGRHDTGFDPAEPRRGSPLRLAGSDLERDPRVSLRRSDSGRGHEVRRRLLAALPLLLVLAARPAVAHATEWDWVSLAHVTEVRVEVKTLPEDISRLGLSQREIKTGIEAKLRLAGMVLSPDADSYLSVRVSGFKSGEYLYVYAVRVDLNQPAMLLRDAETRLLAEPVAGKPLLVDELKTLTANELSREMLFRAVSTWNMSLVGAVGTERNPVEKINQAVQDLVDLFANDSLAAKKVQGVKKDTH